MTFTEFVEAKMSCFLTFNNVILDNILGSGNIEIKIFLQSEKIFEGISLA